MTWLYSTVQYSTCHKWGNLQWLTNRHLGGQCTVYSVQCTVQLYSTTVQCTVWLYSTTVQCSGGTCNSITCIVQEVLSGQLLMLDWDIFAWSYIGPVSTLPHWYHLTPSIIFQFNSPPIKFPPIQLPPIQFPPIQFPTNSIPHKLNSPPIHFPTINSIPTNSIPTHSIPTN